MQRWKTAGYFAGGLDRRLATNPGQRPADEISYQTSDDKHKEHVDAGQFIAAHQCPQSDRKDDCANREEHCFVIDMIAMEQSEPETIQNLHMAVALAMNSEGTSDLPDSQQE